MTRAARRCLLVMGCTLVLAGCGDPLAARLAGKWEGGFEGEPMQAGVAMRPEWRYRGYLQLYASGNRYAMHLESTAQVLDLQGTWSADRGRIILQIKSVDFDDRRGSVLRMPGLEPIPPEQVRAGYGRTLVFDLDEQGPTLKGLTMTIGPLQGRHEFRKSEANRRFPDRG